MKRILIIDDHPILREGLEMIIAQDHDLTPCGSGESAEEALELVGSTHPDLVLTDLNLPGANGIELIKQLREIRPELPVLVISMHDELIYAERVLRVGGRGFVAKDSGTTVLMEAIHRVLDGGVFVSKVVSDSFLHGMAIEGKRLASFPLQRLTKREIEVFELIGKGHNNHEIASTLGISPRTVDAHRGHIREKLGLSDGSALNRFALRWIESQSILDTSPKPSAQLHPTAEADHVRVLRTPGAA